MNMLCLKSCAAHTGFSDKLEFDIFLLMKTMLVDLSMGLCYAIRVTVC